MSRAQVLAIYSGLCQQLARFLEFVQPVVDAAVVQQFLVAADLDDLPLIQYDDFVGLADGAEPVGDDDRGAGAEDAAHG